MKSIPVLLLVAFLFSSCTLCPICKKAPLPTREEPTRVVNKHYARGKVRAYETYELGSGGGLYETRGYKIAFVHMKDGAEYPVPCMPYKDGMTPAMSPVVKGNRTNDAWEISTWFRNKKDGVFNHAIAELQRHEGDLYMGDRKLKRVENVPLLD